MLWVSTDAAESLMKPFCGAAEDERTELGEYYNYDRDSDDHGFVMVRN